MDKLSQRTNRIEIDFTDEALTPLGGSIFVARMAEALDLPRRLAEVMRLKRRRRGASDAETILSMVYSLACGDGALRDVDRLRIEQPRIAALGLNEVPSSRRLGEYLSRVNREALVGLRHVVRGVVEQVAQAVIQDEIEKRGYVPVFMDGTAIEVDGAYVEGAAEGYNGEKQLWLHNVFIGPLWASQRLLAGGGSVTEGWREQLRDDVRPIMPIDAPVWVRADNAYYSGEVVEYCRQKGWDFSISVTSDTYKKPLKRKVERLPATAWAWITDDHTEEAAVIRHRPDGWGREETYLAIRTHELNRQRCLFPRLTFVLVSRTDLPLKELVRRHREKQGQENAQKGPLIDLDLHHPPCLRLAANQAFYTCGQLAQLLLVGVQYHLLPTGARSHGLRTLMRNLIRCAARLVSHGRRRILKFSKHVPRLDWLIHAAEKLDALALT